MPRRPPLRTKTTLLERANAQDAAKAAVRDELHARRLCAADFAAQAGICEQEMMRKTSSAAADRQKHVSLADLSLADDEDFITAVLMRVFGERGIVATSVDVDGRDPDPADLLMHHDAATRAVHHHLQSRADGHISPEEGAALETAALAEVVIALRAALLGKRARKERGGLRVARGK